LLTVATVQTERFKRVIFIVYFFFGSMLVFSQTSDREAGLTALSAGDYSKAVKLLKKATKTNSSDAEAWALLGSACLRKGQAKDARQALGRAVQLEPQNDVNLSGLAVAYQMSGDYRASETAYKALAVNPKNIDAHFVLGIVALEDGSYTSAYQRAQRIIELNPGYASAYRLKSRALVGSYTAQTGTILRPPENRYQLLTEAAADLQKFLDLSTDPQVRKYYGEQVASLNFFAEYFSHPENRLETSIDNRLGNDPSKTPLKILNKPRPSYTDEARRSNAQGTVVLIVSFQSNGKIGPIMVLKSLPSGLNVQAVRAARGIKFTPATNLGMPVTVVKKIEYSFLIY
jgi:TonB family protein